MWRSGRCRFDEANRYDHGVTISGARYGATVRMLLKAGAPLAARDAHGMTCLHAAARARFARALRLMGPAAAKVGSVIDLRSGGPDPRKANMTALLHVASGLRECMSDGAAASLRLTGSLSLGVALWVHARTLTPPKR